MLCPVYEFELANGSAVNKFGVSNCHSLFLNSSVFNRLLNKYDQRLKMKISRFVHHFSEMNRSNLPQSIPFLLYIIHMAMISIYIHFIDALLTRCNLFLMPIVSIVVIKKSPNSIGSVYQQHESSDPSEV